MKINGREVYQLAVRRIVETVNECLDKCGLKIDDMAMLIPHQMNARIIESAAKRLEMPDEKVFMNIAKYGNTRRRQYRSRLMNASEAAELKAAILLFLLRSAPALHGAQTLFNFKQCQ